MGKTAIYPGTFDPITLGHVDIIKRAAKLFDHIIVAVAENPKKKPYFSLKKRLEMIAETFVDLPAIKVAAFEGLTVDFARQQKAQFILRGLRNGTDFDFELQLVGMNNAIFPEIETIFLTASPEYAAISATIVREIAQMKGDVSLFVPEPAKRAFNEVE